jgi:hypothetical protein
MQFGNNRVVLCQIRWVVGWSGSGSVQLLRWLNQDSLDLATARAGRSHFPTILQPTGSDTTTHDCYQAACTVFKILLMMGAKSTRNM